MRREMPHVEQDLSAYLAGKVSSEDKIRIEEHLKECPDCSRQLEVERNLNSILSSSGSIEPSVGFSKKVLFELTRNQKQAKRSRIVFIGIAAAIVIALFLLYVKQEIPKPAPVTKKTEPAIERKPEIESKEEAPVQTEKVPEQEIAPAVVLSPEELEVVANLDELENMEIISNYESLEDLDLALIAESDGSLQ